MERARLAAALIVLTLLAAGCGARFAVPDDTAAQPAAQQAPAVVDDDSPEPTVDPDEHQAAQAPDSPVGEASAVALTEPEQPAATSSPEPWPELDYGERHNTPAFTIALSAECVRRGEVLVVTLQGPPNAGVSMVIAYSDRRPHGNSKAVGQSDDAGRHVWRVLVAPTVPDGDAKVLASTTGGDWEGEGASAHRIFTVANRC